MVLSPCTATTLPAKIALLSRSNTSRRSASILIGSLPPPIAPNGEAASFLAAAGAAGFSAKAGATASVADASEAARSAKNLKCRADASERVMGGRPSARPRR